MIGWLWRVIVGRFTSCRHKWETLAAAELTRCRDNTGVGYMYTLRCTNCGDITSRRVSV